MKVKNNSTTQIMALAAGLALLAATATQAHPLPHSVPSILGLSLTINQQGDSTTNGTVIKDVADKSRFGIKDLHAWLYEVTGLTNARGNAILVVPSSPLVGDEGGPSASTFLIDKEGEIITNLTALIQVGFTSDPADIIIAGTRDEETLKERTKALSLFFIRITDGNGTDVQMFGQATDSYGHSGLKENGAYTESTSVKATVSGSGDIEGAFALVQGTITLKGKFIEEGDVEGPE
jgi:hypothetical protein